MWSVALILGRRVNQKVDIIGRPNQPRLFMANPPMTMYLVPRH
jgi:hypothetical protein